MLDLALICLSLNVFHEAREEAPEAQLAIAMAWVKPSGPAGDEDDIDLFTAPEEVESYVRAARGEQK